MTEIKIEMRETEKRENIRWVIYTDTLSSMLAIDKNRVIHPIFDISTKLYNQGKQKMQTRQLNNQ